MKARHLLLLPVSLLLFGFVVFGVKVLIEYHIIALKRALVCDFGIIAFVCFVWWGILNEIRSGQ